MIGLRRKSWRLYGASVAVLAFCLQVMLSSAGLLALESSTDPIKALASHALCLGDWQNAVPPAVPGNTPPGAPAQHHFAFCCLWHQLPGVTPVAMLPAQPTYHARAVSVELRVAAVIPGPRYGPRNARAPPLNS